MKVILKNTSKVIQFVIDGKTVPARIWEGETESCIPVHAYITRIAVREGRAAEDYKVFESELSETSKPSADIEAIPLRLIL